MLFDVNGLSVSVDDKVILEEISMNVRAGELHVIMGPNGAGKSSFAKTLAGHPSCNVLKGSISFSGESIVDMPPEDRSKMGLFVSMQYPIEIPGVGIMSFLQAVCKSLDKVRGIDRSPEDIKENILNHALKLGLSVSILDRCLNDGFSGGEKKRFEILQMLVLSPKLAVLDEVDSGVDVDALKLVSKSLSEYLASGGSLLLITHYSKLLSDFFIDKVHVISDGRMLLSGGKELIFDIENDGYGI